MTRRMVDLTGPGAEPGGVAHGLAVLAEQVRGQAVAAARPAAPSDGLASLFEAELRLGLEAADPLRAYEAAAALQRRTGSGARTHAAISRVLQRAGQAWADGACSVAREHRITAAASEVVVRLRALAPASPAHPPVVLAVPPGERHVLALDSLALLLAEAGHATDVVGELPPDELAELAQRAPAVVLSVHVPTRTLGTTLSVLREAAPDALLAVGGPAAPRNAAKADLVTQDPAALVTALAGLRTPLTGREREVLRCVADGLSNQEAAEVLAVTPGTVKTHLDNIFAKSGASGRAAAVAVGLRRGWIT